MKLTEEINYEANRPVYPAFPDDKWEYDECRVSAILYLQQPANHWLQLGVAFVSPEEGTKDCNLFCAFEAPQQYRRAEWKKTIGRHQDAFDETWSGYAVGLRRALQSPEHLDEEIRRLLDDFLKCLE